jgi:prephenate dehydrogenase
MHTWDSVAIVGVGLIGGSVGLALRARGLARRVVGVGRRAASLRTARKMGAVTRTSLAVERGVSGANLVVVCTSVGQIVDHVRRAAGHCGAGALITDVGSTKAEIVGRLNGSLGRGVRFVGSHPLAGSEKSGPAQARADLFVGRIVVVTPGGATREEDIRETQALWTALGAKVVVMSAEEHDRILAATSHLPHLVASAVAHATPADCLPLVAGGWLDTTRVAAGDAELWTEIFRDNRRHVRAALARLEKSLAALKGALKQEDWPRLAQVLAEAKRNRDAAGGNHALGS